MHRWFHKVNISMKKFFIGLVICVLVNYPYYVAAQTNKETDGFIWTKKVENGAVSVLDKNNKIIIPIDLGFSDVIYHPEEIYVDVKYLLYKSMPFFEVRKEHKNGICNLKGDVIIQPIFQQERDSLSQMKYRELDWLYSNGFQFITAMTYGKPEIYDLKGNLLVAPIYDKVTGFRYKDFDYFAVNVGDLTSHIDTYGRLIVEPRPEEITEIDGYFSFLSGKKGAMFRMKVSNKLTDYAKENIIVKDDSGERLKMLEQVSILIKQDNYKDAIKISNNIIKRFPCAEAYFYKGFSYYSLGDIEKSLESLRFAMYRDDCSQELLSAVLELKKDAEDKYFDFLQEKRLKQIERSKKWDRILLNLASFGQAIHEMGNQLEMSASENTDESKNVSSSGTQTSANNGSVSSTSKSKKGDFNNYKSLDRSYESYDSQLANMQSFPERYSKQDFNNVPNIQKKMRDIRTKINQMGYPRAQSSRETWHP